MHSCLTAAAVEDSSRAAEMICHDGTPQDLRILLPPRVDTAHQPQHIF